MASFLRSFGFSCLLVVLILAIAEKSNASGYARPIFRSGAWQLAHATFYGDESASETMGMLFTFFVKLYIVLIIIFR